MKVTHLTWSSLKVPNIFIAVLFQSAKHGNEVISDRAREKEVIVEAKMLGLKQQCMWDTPREITFKNTVHDLRKTALG